MHLAGPRVKRAWTTVPIDALAGASIRPVCPRVAAIALERPDLTARDLHPIAVELSHDEAVEVLVLSAAMVAQEPERLLFADEEAADAVGAVVDAASRLIRSWHRRTNLWRR